MRSLELTTYVYVWDNYRLLELPWDSAWTWWLSFLAVDLGYYWLHRFAHGRPAQAHARTRRETISCRIYHRATRHSLDAATREAASTLVVWILPRAHE